MGKIITPEEFVNKWSHSKLSERSASHQHFIDLCNLLHEKTPAEDDPDGSNYTFEKGIHTTSGHYGWADVWKRKFFAWEYKSHHKSLQAAYAQLQQYAPALENPPLLIVSDMNEIDIHTNWTNKVSKEIKIRLVDILNPDYRMLLRAVFNNPNKFNPDKTREQITEDIAKKFIHIAKNIRKRGYDSNRIARFLNKLVFCMFAQDIGLLPHNLFLDIVTTWIENPNKGIIPLKQLFKAMREGEFFGAKKIAWFNGGLFEKADDAIPLTEEELKLILDACQKEWNDIEPAIFGNLFERSLDPKTVAQLGVSYTDEESINKIINPVITEPLRNEWLNTKTLLEHSLKNNKSTENDNLKHAQSIYNQFLTKLQNFKILDPACGSGNFLNIALRKLKDIEHEVILEAEKFNFVKPKRKIGPHNVMGIDINPYATEIAKVSLWICDLQWTIKHGYWIPKNPILQNLDNIESRDALLNNDAAEASWPDADVIIGNPPYLGDKKMLSVLGQEYVNKIRHVFKNKIPPSSDLVSYWFVKATECLIKNKNIRVGFVSTNSIRGGKNRKILDIIYHKFCIYNAWSDLPWSIDGVNVRVSIINFADKNNILIKDNFLDGKKVDRIYPDLSGGNNVVNITLAKRLEENINTSFIGIQKTGAFDIDGITARKWLVDINIHNKLNQNILHPIVNGFDITHRSTDRFIIDFNGMSEKEASNFEKPFEYISKYVKPSRINSKYNKLKNKWWQLSAKAVGLRNNIKNISRFIVTPRISKHRIFVWLNKKVIPDCQLVVFSKEDDTTFGILQSHFHEVWTLKMCTWLGIGNDPRYTPTTTFETFPFPDGLTPNISSSRYENDPLAIAIADAARELNALREEWLNPNILVHHLPEIIKGYPERIIPRDKESEKILKSRTLTNLYNNKPQWLINAHKKLDDAVAIAYGWETNLTDEEILKRLLALNLERSSKSKNLNNNITK